MASSKSSGTRRSRSIYSFSLSSLLLRRPSSPSTSSSSTDGPAADDQASRPPTAQRRKSHLGILSSWRSPLNSDPADLIHRKPVAADHPAPPPPPPAYHPHEFQPAFDGPAGLDAIPPLPANAHHHQHLPPPNGPDPYDHSAAMPRVIQKRQKPASVAAPSHPPPPPPRDGAVQPPPAAAPPVHDAQTPAAPQSVLKKSRDTKKRRSSMHHTGAPVDGSRRSASPSPEPRGRSSSAQPPLNKIAQLNAATHGRLPSPQTPSRPHSAHSSDGASPHASSERAKLHRSWLPPGRSRSNSQEMAADGHDSTAWILTSDSRADYNTTFLTSGEKVPELWNDNGNVYVYLGPRGHNPPSASFKVPAYTVSHSLVFSRLIQADASSPVTTRSRARSFSGRDNLSADDAVRRALSPPNSPPPRGGEAPGEYRLFLPQGPGMDPMSPVSPAQQPRQDLDRLVALRNLFAFLTGQPLVGTPAHPTVFAALLQIASLLREFEFSNVDGPLGSSFGEAAQHSFDFYAGHLGLADVRYSREKSVEALVLGEQMKSWELYNEAFAHAVGKYAAIMDIKSPLFQRVSLGTQRRLERAHLDLLNRQHNVNIRLEQFDFPSLFAGTASSTSNSDFKNIRFKNWKAAFGDMRSFVLKYYKGLYGNWPPKASSKKNPFSVSGLNRQVLKTLYSDLCALYDLLVDRESITPRVIDQSPDDLSGAVDPTILALRRVLGEFDRSSPPVLPPIPFDVPKIPTMCSIKETYGEMAPKDQARFDRNVQSHEWQLIMLKSHNIDTDGLHIPFLDSFKEFELKEARTKSSAELSEQRIGYWLFLYVVLQSMPMLVIDAPDLHYTDGVEYFLCEPPQGNPPWLEDAGGVRKMWYQTTSGTNVELSADVVMFSVEATYHRSHCWVMAKQWEEALGGRPGRPPHQALSPLEPPHAAFQDMEVMASPSSLRGQSPSPSSATHPQQLPLPVRGRSPRPVSSAYRPSSIAIGLEPLNFEDGMAVASAGGSSRTSWGSNPPHPAAHRSASAHNLHSRANGRQSSGHDSPRESPRHVSHGTGSTFDSILQNMDNQKKDTKKKGSFLPF